MWKMGLSTPRDVWPGVQMIVLYMTKINGVIKIGQLERDTIYHLYLPRTMVGVFLAGLKKASRQKARDERWEVVQSSTPLES